MSEFQIISEQQLYEQEVDLYKKQLADLEGAGKTSTVCPKVVDAMIAAEANDGFLTRDGIAKPNQFHRSKGTSGDGGCCVLS